MKSKWNDKSMQEKVMWAVRLAVSAAVVVLAALQLFGVWDRAIHVAVPLVGIVLLVQSVQEWQQQRGVAVLGLCAALFIFGCAAAVWFF